jgi:hypothetical protein
MVESDRAEGADAPDPGASRADPISPFEAANYIVQLTREMAGLATAAGLFKVAAALELAHDLAAQSDADRG